MFLQNFNPNALKKKNFLPKVLRNPDTQNYNLHSTKSITTKKHNTFLTDTMEKQMFHIFKYQ